MLNFILGACGTGKSYTIIQKIKDSYLAGRKCLVITPDQFSYEYDKKIYDILGSRILNNIDAFSFSRLTRDIFLKFGGLSGEYADDLTKFILMSLAVKNVKEQDKLSYYNNQSKKPDFISSMLEVVKELKWSDIHVDELQNNIPDDNSEVSYKTKDIIEIVNKYYNLMHDKEKKDSLNDITEATKKAKEFLYFKNTDVFIDEFHSFSKDEFNLIEQIVVQADNVYLALPSGNNRSLFSIVNNTYESLVCLAKAHNKRINIIRLDKQVKYKNADMSFLSSNLFSLKNTEISQSDNIKIYESSDMYQEADYIAAQISHLVNSKQYKYSDIAVVTKNIEDYTTLIESSFNRYDIPFFLDFKDPIRHKSIILLITSVLDIVACRYPNTESILRYLKTGLSAIATEDVCMLENYVYKWSIDGKLWLQPFMVNEDEKNIEVIRNMVIAPLIKLKQSIKKSSAKEYCSAFFKFFENINLQENINNEFKSNENRNEIVRETKQLWNIVVNIFDTIYSISDDDSISVKDFENMFLLMVGESNISTPPQLLDSVIVSTTDRARLNSPKVTFIMGANDGQFPAIVKSFGLLNDRDRQQLKTRGILLQSDSLNKSAIEKFICYTSISSPTEKLYISYSLSDLSGKRLYPTYLTNKITRLFNNKVLYRISDVSPIYFCTTGKALYYTYIQQFRKKDEEFEAIKKCLEKDPLYCGKIQKYEMKSKSSQAETLNNKLTDRLFGKSLYLSASRFEDYNNCPFIYFCKKGLNLYPQDKIELGSMSVGNIIHFCAYSILKKYSKKDFVNLSQEALTAEIEGLLKIYYNDTLGGDFAKTNSFNFEYARISENLAEILMHLQREFSQCQFVPSDFELDISKDNNSSPLHLITYDGRHLYFTGKIDRVDIYKSADKDFVRVIDYKSGIKKFNLEDVYYGINMQMLLYLFTIIANGKYKEFVPAGVLYMPSKELTQYSSRDASLEDIIKMKEKEFKMNGIILDNADVAKAMEENADGIFVPVKLKGDEFSKASQIISESGLGKLKEHCFKLLTDMADNLYNGNVAPLPISYNDKMPCQYCDYCSICGRDLSDKNGVRICDKEKSEEFVKELGSDNNDNKVD